MYGLQRQSTTSPTNKSPVPHRKKTESLLMPSTTHDSSTSNKEDTYSLSNNEIELDDFDYKSTAKTIDVAGSAADTSVTNNDDDDDENIGDDLTAELDADNYSTGIQLTRLKILKKILNTSWIIDACFQNNNEKIGLNIKNRPS